jgi:cytochrome c oxidase subunit II
MNNQNVFDTAGPDGERLATLAWLLFGGGLVLFVAVLGFLLVALYGAAKARRTLGHPRFIVAGGIIMPVVVLTALLAHTLGLARALGLPLPGDVPPLRIEVIGHQFWWEVRYPEARIVTANEIRIPTGRDVVLEVTASDVIHSLWIPALHGKIDMIPGMVNRRTIRADRPGTMRGQCTEFCGTQHAMMAFMVVAETPEGFDTWLDRRRLPAETPPEHETGRRVFAAAGCGGCHAVQGTEWDARIGPDLSGIGGRLTIGAGILPMNEGTIAGWIAGAQDLKPGNRMPSYANALDGPELRAVSAWLESLK